MAKDDKLVRKQRCIEKKIWKNYSLFRRSFSRKNLYEILDFRYFILFLDRFEEALECLKCLKIT